MRGDFRQSLVYKSLVVIILIAALLLLSRLAMERLMDPQFLFLDDYVEYWSAGRLNLLGGNPYDPDQMAALQIGVGRTEGVPIMMWNPPWTLALAMPLSWLDYPLSRLIWLLLNLGIIFFAADWGWRVYGGAPERRWMAWLVALTFGPALHVLKAGQIAPLLLLGVTGFLYFARRERWWAAGACATLITIKPHLLYLFGLALVLWALDRQRWVVLGGFGLTLIAAMGVVWAVNPALIDQYTYALANYPPAQWATPTFGALLRVWLGVEKFWLQFVPSAFGALWFLFYWRTQRVEWDWTEQIPVLVLVSVATAAYGWTFDHTVSLLAIVQALIWLTRRRLSWATGGLLGAYVALMGVSLFSSMDQLWYWWMASWFLGWYLVVRRVEADVERSYSPNYEGAGRSDGR